MRWWLGQLISFIWTLQQQEYLYLLNDILSKAATRNSDLKFLVKT